MRTLLLAILCFLTTCANAELPPLHPQSNNGKYWPNSTRYLVIVHQYDGDVSWASRLNFPHIIYEKNKPENEPFNAINKAKGETNLLKFIAEFYDDLPDNIIQVYQYEHKAYHESSLVDILNSPEFELKYARSKTPGFWNFNITDMGDVAFNTPRMIESGWWPVAMAPWFGDINDYGNFTQGKRSCAQFVVSRERIRSMPRDFYWNMYWWLVNNTLDEPDTGIDPATKTRILTLTSNNSNSNYFTSRYMEWSWELIYTIHKPHEDIAIPFLRASNDSQKPLGWISAVYGALKYYRDVTPEVVYRFLRNGKIVIPISANFNEFFTDVVYGSPKTLIITIDGKEYRIPESRPIDIVIKLS